MRKASGHTPGRRPHRLSHTRHRYRSCSLHASEQLPVNDMGSVICWNMLFSIKTADAPAVSTPYEVEVCPLSVEVAVLDCNVRTNLSLDMRASGADAPDAFHPASAAVEYFYAKTRSHRRLGSRHVYAQILYAHIRNCGIGHQCSRSLGRGPIRHIQPWSNTDGVGSRTRNAGDGHDLLLSSAGAGKAAIVSVGRAIQGRVILVTNEDISTVSGVVQLIQHDGSSYRKIAFAAQSDRRSSRGISRGPVGQVGLA